MIYALSKITKAHGGRIVLDIPALEIAAGQVCALVGPNGAGKTTLLELLAFLDRPTTGAIAYHGRPVAFSESALQPVRRNVVLVSQRPVLFTATVYRNLEFGLKVRKIPGPRRREIIEEALALVRLERFADAPAQRLSAGETQRVALARALALAPEVILLDEPTASVDPENKNLIYRVLGRIRETGKTTVVFATHDKQEASALAHRTLFLDNGRLVPRSYDNLFPADIESAGGGFGTCRVNGIVAWTLRTERTGAARVIIDPEKIAIAAGDEGGPAAPGIRGTIVQAFLEGPQVRLVVDAGMPVTVLVPRARYEALAPFLGSRVALSIPADAVQIL